MDRALFIIFLSSVLCFVGMNCDCKAADISDFQAIDPANYNRNYSSITSVGERPYGFQKATWYYNNPSRSNPCVKVTGASNRRVEVMIEAVPKSRICLRDQNRDLGCANGGIGRLYTCKRARTDTPVFEFYCDNECEEHNVQFWYRIVLGDTPDQDPEDHWCDNRSHDEYPEDLLQLPLDYTFPVDTTPPMGHAQSTLRPNGMMTHFLLTALLCFTALIFSNNR